MQQDQKHFPAFPTFPIQDNLGQIVSFAGLSKLEYMAAILAAGWWQHSNTLPEVIAKEAIEIAKEILIKCNEKNEDEIEKPSKIITLGK